MNKEMENALNKKLYRCDDELYSHLIECKSLCLKYNNCDPKDYEGSNRILDMIIAKHGKNIRIVPPFYCDYGYNIEIGNNFYSNHNLVVLDCNKIKIGDNVLIGPNCTISAAAHPIKPEVRLTGYEYALPITIGDNVWIGANVTILPGVTIGSDSVIGANSLVNKDIPNGVVAAGNPCKVLRSVYEGDDKYEE